MTSVLAELWGGLGGDTSETRHVTETGTGSLRSVFAVTDLAVASIGVASLAVSELIALHGGAWRTVTVDRRLASMWFATSLRPHGWEMPPPWDAIAGVYRASDTWIRLHTNAHAHREAALAVLGVAAEKSAVAQAVSHWNAASLESAIVDAGGCAAMLRSAAEWATHPQGRAVAAEPLLHIASTGKGNAAGSDFHPGRPLQGLRVLDLTRVLAGPIATRFLAGLGAAVLRVDPPWWDEPAIVPEVTPGKRCAHLDLRDPVQRVQLRALLAGCDVMVHGYRPGALERLGLGPAERQELRPGLVDVSLDAYGWTGPWNGRRGFDSLVQMSTGIAEAGMRGFGGDRPVPLPVQALDHATGYLLAAAAIRGITQRLRTGRGSIARGSLARVAAVLLGRPGDPCAPLPHDEGRGDLADGIEPTIWGPARRLRSPLGIGDCTLMWRRAASALGSAAATWDA